MKRKLINNLNRPTEDNDAVNCINLKKKCLQSDNNN